MNKQKIKALVRGILDEIAYKEQHDAFHYNKLKKFTKEIENQLEENVA